MRSKSVIGIVYRIFNSGETDKIIFLIDKNGSKNVFLAKGVKKNNSKKAHSLNLCNLVEVKYIEGYALAIATEIKLIDEFNHLKTISSDLFIIQLFCEIIDKLCYQENPEKDLFNLFLNILKIKDKNTLLIANIFILKSLFITGSIRSINISAISNNSLSQNDIYFSESIVGYISNQDMQSNIELKGELINSKLAKAQKYIIENPIKNCLLILLPNKDLVKLISIELSWFENIIEQRLKSKSIILSILNKTE